MCNCSASASGESPVSRPLGNFLVHRHNCIGDIAAVTSGASLSAYHSPDQRRWSCCLRDGEWHLLQWGGWASIIRLERRTVEPVGM